MIENLKIGKLAPYWASIVLAMLVPLAAIRGGWYIFLIPAYAFIFSSLLDRILGDNNFNPDPTIEESAIFWHRLITLIWLPIQVSFVFFTLVAVTRFDHLSNIEGILMMMALGIATGAVGIVYSHELIHQRNLLERRLGDGLLAMVCYGHFRTKHIKLHHRNVGTPGDPVTARYNEGFHRFFARLIWQGLRGSWQVEAERLARKDLPLWHRSNPFWIYLSWPLVFLTIAWLIGGWAGIGLYLLQAFIAVGFLELSNYVEHYGLVRKYLGNEKYEPVHPHHSWNSARRFTNYMLINLQRHSDHHYYPERRFPLLQTYDAREAPQLPYGYPMMGAIAMVPPLWRRVMNPRVRKWRAMYYPEITDWSAYNNASNPKPR